MSDPLPVCGHRHYSRDPEIFQCDSKKNHTGPGGYVWPEWCRGCIFADETGEEPNREDLYLLPDFTSSRASSFVRASLAWIAARLPFPGWEAYRARLKVCDACPFRKRSGCRLCGCFIPVKACYPGEACPAGFWRETDYEAPKCGGCDDGGEEGGGNGEEHNLRSRDGSEDRESLTDSRAFST